MGKITEWAPFSKKKTSYNRYDTRSRGNKQEKRVWFPVDQVWGCSSSPHLSFDVTGSLKWRKEEKYQCKQQETGPPREHSPKQLFVVLRLQNRQFFSKSRLQGAKLQKRGFSCATRASLAFRFTDPTRVRRARLPSSAISGCFFGDKKENGKGTLEKEGWLLTLRLYKISYSIKYRTGQCKRKVVLKKRTCRFMKNTF